MVGVDIVEGKALISWLGLKEGGSCSIISGMPTTNSPKLDEGWC